MLRIGKGIAQGSSPYPKCGDGLATAATAEMIPLTAAETSDGRQLVMRRTIRRPREAEQAERGRRGSESFPNFARGYI